MRCCIPSLYTPLVCTCMSLQSHTSLVTLSSDLHGRECCLMSSPPSISSIIKLESIDFHSLFSFSDFKTFFLRSYNCSENTFINTKCSMTFNYITIFTLWQSLRFLEERTTSIAFALLLGWLSLTASSGIHNTGV